MDESLDFNPGDRSTWRGVMDGGPLDSGEVSIEAVPGAGMRGMRIEILVGDELADASWHLYRLAGERMVEERGVLLRFVYLGTREDDPSGPDIVDY